MAIVQVLLVERWIIDVARQLRVVPAQAKGRPVTEGHIQHALARSARPTVREVLASDLSGRGELRRVGSVRHVLQQPAFTPGAIERALRTAQHFHALQVPGVKVTGETKSV